ATKQSHIPLNTCDVEIAASSRNDKESVRGPLKHRAFFSPPAKAYTWRLKNDTGARGHSTQTHEPLPCRKTPSQPPPTGNCCPFPSPGCPGGCPRRPRGFPPISPAPPCWRNPPWPTAPPLADHRLRHLRHPDHAARRLGGQP